MSGIKKPRRVRPGQAAKEIERTAKLRQQIEDERVRHRSAMNDLTLRRELAHHKNDPEAQGIELRRIMLKEIDEGRRHRSKISSLQTRIFKKS